MSRRLAAILAADVAGYSRLMEEDEDGTLSSLHALQAEVIDPTIAKHRGRIVKLMGDGLLAEFASVADAVDCALDVQQGIAERAAGLPENRQLRFRIGINLGDIIIRENDIYGDGVNIAARLQELAAPGAVCIAGAVFDQMRRRTGLAFDDLGEQRVKNIERPLRVYRVVSGVGSTSATTLKVSGTSFLDFHSPQKPSIAILPFKSLSTDPGQDYLSDGIRLGIQATLVQLSGLFLVNAPAANQYRNAEVSAARAGHELKVDYVLGGAIQQAGNRVRAILELTDTSAGQIVWAKNFDRVLDDVFKLQDEITEEVISSLHLEILIGEPGRIWYGKLTSPEARECFYRGLSDLYKGTKEANASARRYFEELTRVQPDIVNGPSNVSVTHWLDAFFGWTDPGDSMEQAMIWAKKAVEYEDNDGLGYGVLGHALLLAGRHEEAIESCRKGVAYRASCPLSHGQLALVSTYCGDATTAVKLATEAISLERTYPTWLINVLAGAYRDAGALDKSIPAARESVRLDPRTTDGRIILCSDYSLAGQRDEAKRVAEDIVAMDPGFRLADYARTQPYKEPEVLERLVESLREAGLPD
jgi:class 3 adenylate cyclase/tetratricopeptide (TPR) repeat protein